MSEKLETLFAIEFGQLLENHLLGSPKRDEQTVIICSCLQLRNKQQLAQIFAGYDMPSTANIFELIRTLNDEEFTQRFFSLQTTTPNLAVDKKEPVAVAEPSEPEKTEAELIAERKPYWMNEPDENDLRSKDDIFGDLGDLSLLKDFKL